MFENVFSDFVGMHGQMHNIILLKIGNCFSGFGAGGSVGFGVKLGFCILSMTVKVHIVYSYYLGSSFVHTLAHAVCIQNTLYAASIIHIHSKTFICASAILNCYGKGS